MKNLSIFIIVMCAVILVGFWWLPPDLKSPVTHSRWFRAIASVFESDTRVMIADNSYPWRSIGIVHGRGAMSWQCTGFLIGPDKVVTSRHCVTDEHGRIYPDLRYSVVRHTHFGRLTFDARDVRTHALEDAGGEETEAQVDPALDLAVFVIADRVGAIVGYFGTVRDRTATPSLRGSMADEDIRSVNDLCHDTIRDLPWNAASGSQHAPNDLGLTWIAPDPANPPRICAAGFSGDLGYVRLSVAHACGLLALGPGVVIHDCFISNGASGGPLFYLDQSGAPVAFATNTATGESEELNELFGEGQKSLGTLLTDLID